MAISPDRSNCLSSFFWLLARRRSRRANNQKNSECGEQEEAPDILATETEKSHNLWDF